MTNMWRIERYMFLLFSLTLCYLFLLPLLVLELEFVMSLFLCSVVIRASVLCATNRKDLTTVTLLWNSLERYYVNTCIILIIVKTCCLQVFAIVDCFFLMDYEGR